MGFFYPNGLSSKSGAHALLRGAIYTSAEVQWVDSVNGDDSYLGTYQQPKATLGAADTTVHRIIVLKNGHSETFTSALALQASTVVGEDSTAGVPNATLGMNAASAAQFLGLGAGTEILNIKFPAQEQSNVAPHLSVDADGVRVADCRFETDVNDQLSALYTVASYAYVHDCVIVSAATSISDAPPLLMTHSTGEDLLEVSNCTLDGGAYGTSSNPSTSSGTGDGLRAIGISCLNGAQYDVFSHEVVAVGSATGGGGVGNLADEYVFAGGVSSDTSDALLAASYVVTEKPVYFVDSSKADSLEYGNPENPYKTLAGLIDDIGGTIEGAVIVLKANHSETVTSTITIADSYVTLVGETGATLTLGADTDLMGEGFGIQIRNVTFEASVAMSSTNRLVKVGWACTFVGCTFNMSENLTGFAAEITDASSYVRFEDCTFTSTATSVANAPYGGLKTNEAPFLRIINCTFDGGSSGFENYAIENNTATEAMLIQGLTLRNGVDVNTNSSSTGYIHVDADPTCRVRAF